MESTLKKKNYGYKQKKVVFTFLMILLLMQVQVFAQGSGITVLDDWGQTIVGLFTSTWLKAICIVALIFICIGMITTGRNEPGMIKKFVPWFIGVIILLSATGIVGFFFEGSDLGNIQ